MSEQTSETAPVTTTETAPVQTTEQTSQTIVQQTQEVKAPSIRESLLAKLPKEKTKWLEKYKDDDSTVNGIMSAIEMVGKKGDIPKEDAPSEAFKEFWNKLGADKVELNVPEFGEEYGDLGGQLKEYYSGVNSKVTEILNNEIANAKNIPDLFNKVMNKFIAEDAEAARLREVETKKQMEESFKKVAIKSGLSAEQLKATNDEVIKKYGWDDTTSFAEILYTLAKETSNTNVIKDSFMNNTSQGLEMQLQEIVTSDEYLYGSGAKHDLAVKNAIELMTKLNAMQK